jgi:hypothetical protein
MKNNKNIGTSPLNTNVDKDLAFSVEARDFKDEIEFGYYIAGFSDASEKKALVVFGTNLTSTVGNGRLTKQVSEMIKLPSYQRGVVIGLLLSDGWLIFASATNKNARLGFKQALSNSAYV